MPGAPQSHVPGAPTESIPTVGRRALCCAAACMAADIATATTSATPQPLLMQSPLRPRATSTIVELCREQSGKHIPIYLTLVDSRQDTPDDTSPARIRRTALQRSPY